MMRPGLQNETDRAQPAQLHGVDDRVAPRDLQFAALDAQLVAVVPDEGADALVAPEAVHGEIGLDFQRRAVALRDAHVGDHAARARGRILGVGVRLLQARDAGAYAV